MKITKETKLLEFIDVLIKNNKVIRGQFNSFNNRIKRKELLSIVKKLAKRKLSISNQFIIFKEKTKCSRSTFFRCRIRLGLKNNNQHPNQYRGYDKPKHKCYFCSLPSTEKHHIDRNRKNNDVDNLIFMCGKCHRRLHLIYNSLGISKNKK